MSATITRPGIEACPPAGHGVHTWLLRAAHACRRTGMTPAQSIRVLGENVTRQPGPMEIEQAVEKAFAAQLTRIKPRVCKHSYKPDRLTQIARRMDGFGPAELAARSPIRPDTRTPASFLHSLYKPGEQILLFTRFRSQGQAVATRPPDGEPYDARALEEFTKPPEGTRTPTSARMRRTSPAALPTGTSPPARLSFLDSPADCSPVRRHSPSCWSACN